MLVCGSGEKNYSLRKAMELRLVKVGAGGSNESEEYALS